MNWIEYHSIKEPPKLFGLKLQETTLVSLQILWK